MSNATAAHLANDYRDAARALRGITRNDGRTAATSNAIERHLRRQDRAVRALLALGRRDLVGTLRDEEQLAIRLVGVGRGERPELRARIANARRLLAAA